MNPMTSTLLDKKTGMYYKRTDKKQIKVSSYIKKFRREQLQSHTWLTACSWLNICAFPHILGNPSSYMTLQPLPNLSSLIYEENFIFFFISVHCSIRSCKVIIILMWKNIVAAILYFFTSLLDFSTLILY